MYTRFSIVHLIVYMCYTTLEIPGHGPPPPPSPPPFVPAHPLPSPPSPLHSLPLLTPRTALEVLETWERMVRLKMMAAWTSTVLNAPWLSLLPPAKCSCPEESWWKADSRSETISLGWGRIPRSWSPGCTSTCLRHWCGLIPKLYTDLAWE